MIVAYDIFGGAIRYQHARIVELQIERMLRMRGSDFDSRSRTLVDMAAERLEGEDQHTRPFCLLYQISNSLNGI